MGLLGGPPPKPPREAGFSTPPEPNFPEAPPIPRDSNWIPKYPFGVAHGWELPEISPHPETVRRRRQLKHPGQTAGYVYRNVGDRTGYTASGEGGGWLYVPVTSHISRFLWTDARLNPAMAEYGAMGGASHLQVIFKGENYEGESDEYVYYFNDHDRGLQIASELSRASHPYADVLLPMVIQAGIPYFRLAHEA